MQRMKACVIFNPVARGDKARRFQSHLNEVAHDAVLKPTTRPGAARPLAGNVNWLVRLRPLGRGTANKQTHEGHHRDQPMHARVMPIGQGGCKPAWR